MAIGKPKGIHTSLQRVDLVQGIPLRAIPLLELGDLHGLAKLLEIPLPPRICAGFFPGRLVDQLLPHLAHLVLRLHHLGKVVCRSRKWHALPLESPSSFFDGVQ